MARTPHKPPFFTEEDQDLWQLYSQTVKPLGLDKDKKITVEIAKKISVKEKKAEQLFPFVPPSFQNEIASLAVNHEQQLDSHWRRRLDQGKIPIEAIIDLHGLTQIQAHDALLKFIQQSIIKKRRLILVITGKGRGGRLGVIKQNFLHWLDESPHRTAILSVLQAKKHHGGSGAFYILLRRKNT